MRNAIPKKPLAFMLHALRPYKYLAAGVALAACIGAGTESLQPYIVKLLVDSLNTNLDVTSALFLHRVIRIGIGFAILRCLIVSAWWCFNSLYARTEPLAERTIRDDLLEDIFRHSYSWYLEGFAGRTGQRIDTIARSFRDFFLLTTDDLLYVSVRGLTLLGLLTFTDIYLGIGMLVWIALAAPVHVKITSVIEKESYVWVSDVGRFTQHIVDICVNIFSVRSNSGAIEGE